MGCLGSRNPSPEPQQLPLWALLNKLVNGPPPPPPPPPPSLLTQATSESLQARDNELAGLRAQLESCQRALGHANQGLREVALKTSQQVTRPRQ